jgi:hypothetical protein
VVVVGVVVVVSGLVAGVFEACVEGFIIIFIIIIRVPIIPEITAINAAIIAVRKLILLFISDIIKIYYNTLSVQNKIIYC